MAGNFRNPDLGRYRTAADYIAVMPPYMALYANHKNGAQMALHMTWIWGFRHYG